MNVHSSTPNYDRFSKILECCASQPDVRREVIRNHDDNLWWPRKVEDWRLRMVIAGWSTRISYNMISTYRSVVDAVAQLGYERLSELTDDELTDLVRPLGLFNARLRYFRSLQQFIVKLQSAKINPEKISNDDFVEAIAREVRGAGYKVAQCAALYAKGYHCGIIPIDSGMKDMLGPCLGFQFPRGSRGHEVMRKQIEMIVQARTIECRTLADRTGYAELAVPDKHAPSWWVHLVLIYFKRLHCNTRKPHLCPIRQDDTLSHYIGMMCDPNSPKRGGNSAPLSK